MILHAGHIGFVWYTCTEQVRVHYQNLALNAMLLTTLCDC
jgi:hypothetical protein